MKRCAVIIQIMLISATGCLAASEGAASTGKSRVSSPTDAAKLEALKRDVLENNPALQAAKAKWEAKQERPRIVRSLPDPKLTYGHFFENVETRVGAMSDQIKLAQKIPFPGKLSLAEKKARKEALMAMWEYQSLTQKLIRKVKLAYYDLYRLAGFEDVLNQELEVLSFIIETARARYESGQGQQQDVLKAQLMRTDLQNRLLALDEQRQAALARLNALRDQPQESPFQTSKELDLPTVPKKQKALAVAEQYHQQLQASGVAIDRDEINLKLAKKERWPDFTVGAKYTRVNDRVDASPPDDGQDAVMGFVSINIPLWFGKLNAREREARRKLESSRQAESDLRNTVLAEAQSAWFQVDVNRDQVTLFEETLLPQAEQTFDASRAGYEAGKVSFIDLLDSERLLLKYRLGLITARTTLAKSIARLEQAIGAEIQHLPDNPMQPDQAQ